MRKWIKEVAQADVQDGVKYFLAKQVGAGMYADYMFLSENRKGKRFMSTKPGIAVRVTGGNELRDILKRHPDHRAIEIPKDADRRWRMRR